MAGYILFGISALLISKIIAIKAKNRNSVTIYHKNRASNKVNALLDNFRLEKAYSCETASIGYEILNSSQYENLNEFYLENLFYISPNTYIKNQLIKVNKFICVPEKLPETLVSRYLYENGIESGFYKNELSIKKTMEDFSSTSVYALVEYKSLKSLSSTTKRLGKLRVISCNSFALGRFNDLIRSYSKIGSFSLLMLKTGVFSVECIWD